ncbi:MAG: hypothetical protein HY360_09230 [Verrucomicrobia bacterium]|nr:hypothetical protein [Verrucomicrobiota bacterium]
MKTRSRYLAPAPPWRRLGRESVRREFTQAHQRRLHQWFDDQGRFVYPGRAPNSRERLWNCFSLLNGEPRDVRLANRIMVRTPIEPNNFAPIAAVELLLRHARQLTPAARQRPLKLCGVQYLNMLETRFASPAVHDFACMGTFFLADAPLVMDRYEFKSPVASIPEVYNRERMQAVGRNAIRALYWHAQRPGGPQAAPSWIIHQFNSPTYTPVSLLALANIAELVPDPETRELALQMEAGIWRELLAFYHPHLGCSCGPYSCAYAVDALGQSSQARILLAYTGLSRDRSVVELLDAHQPDLLIPHDGDLPFAWSGPAWIMSTKYHVPQDALSRQGGIRGRRFPKRLRARTTWGEFGTLDRKRRRIVSVQGNLLPAGESELVQVQRQRWCLGYRRLTHWGNTFPIHLHYALQRNVRSMRDIRSVISGVMFQGKPQEWTADQRGGRIETAVLVQTGKVTVRPSRDGRWVAFAARAMSELSPIPIEECSVNTLIPTHFTPVSEARLNGQLFDGQPIMLRARKARLSVQDHGARFFVEYRFRSRRGGIIQLFRWAKYIRFAAFLYRGKRRRFSGKQLDEMRMSGHFEATVPKV